MRTKKFNNGNGAILCSKCRVIVLEGFFPEGTITQEAWDSDEPLYCDKCRNSKPKDTSDGTQSS